jgi:hypothetical protein
MSNPRNLYKCILCGADKEASDAPTLLDGAMRSTMRASAITHRNYASGYKHKGRRGLPKFPAAFSFQAASSPERILHVW